MSLPTTTISEELPTSEFYALLYTLPPVILVSCATFHFYYSALHFDEEVEYIWSRKWTVGKVMYLLTRYSGGLFLLYAAAGLPNQRWNQPWFTIHHTYNSLILKYFNDYFFAGLGPMIMLLAEIILQMRVYALYGRRKMMLVSFVLLTLVLFGSNVVQAFGFMLEAAGKICIGRNCDVIEDVRDIYVNLGIPMSAIGWMLTSIVELILFVLVLRKTRQVRKENAIRTSSLAPMSHRSMNRDITSIMAKDSAVYFGVIFTVCLVGTVLAFVSEVDWYVKVPEPVVIAQVFIAGLMNAYQAATIAIMTILAPKLLINLRAEYYGPVGILTESSQLSWNVAEPRRVAGSGGTDECMSVETSA